jgi:hypothetical protein
MGPGTVTDGPGMVTGTIYAGGPVATQAQIDAVIEYNYLMLQVPTTTYPAGVIQLNNRTFTPGVYSFKPSANLMVNGTLFLDFQNDPNAMFIFQTESDLVMMAGSKVIAINTGNSTCLGSNVYWAVGSSATIDGAEFIGNVIALTSITMNSINEKVFGRIWALNGKVTMVASTISICGGSAGVKPTNPCRDFVTGGGWINDKATFGVSGGIKHDKLWGQLSFNDHNGTKVKSTSVTAYIIVDSLTRQIEGTARVNGTGSFTYRVVVVDNGEPGRNDSFSLALSNGYNASGILKGGNIQLHKECGESHDKDDKEKYSDKDERDGHGNCDNDDNDHDKKDNNDHDKKDNNDHNNDNNHHNGNDHE